MIVLLLLTLADAAPLDLGDYLDQVQLQVDSLSADSCADTLQGVFDRLAPLRADQVDMAEVAAQGGEHIDQLWQIRQRLQRQLTEIHAAGGLSDACVTGARRYDLATRYLVDHLYLAGVQHDPWLLSQGFTGTDDLRAGDILVTRGDKLSSGGIAHMGRVDSQFSHNAMVHIDDQGEVWTIEAYLEKGALVQPLHDFLGHGLGRIVVVRYQDTALAAKGAALAYERVSTGAAIDYDEAFDGSNADELFCSEIGPWALAMAGGPSDVPLHTTRFPRAENPAMFAAMGIETDVLAAPVDLLYDPRFSLIAEWRALPQLEQMRRQDAVVESTFRWMERGGYQLDPTWTERTTVNVGLALRRTPLIGRALAGIVHPHGDKGFLIAGLALQDAGEALYADLNTALDAKQAPLSRDEMLVLLEQLRVDDLARWLDKPRRSHFHRSFHPAQAGAN